MVYLFIQPGLSFAQTLGYETYRYIVRPGDTLSEVVLMYAGSHDFERIARANDISFPDLILPEQQITVPSSRPIETLRRYLRAIYQARASDAYRLLSSATRQTFSFEAFKRSIGEMTLYDLDTISICADFICNGNHILQMKVYLDKDVANWGFNLIREKYKWYILLFDLNPTSPQENGYVEWMCN